MPRGSRRLAILAFRGNTGTRPRDLHEMISKGEFLADLHDRPTFEAIFVPPLRDRQGDVAILSQYFLDQFGRAGGNQTQAARRLGLLYHQFRY